MSSSRSPAGPPTATAVGAVGTGQTQPRARVLVAQLSAPLRAFAANETGSAALLLAATIVALVWANSPWSASYVSFWHTEFALRVGNSELALDLQHWVNDGLMVVFFFVVGLEVKRELVMGELTDRRRAAVPVAAAVAGLAVPAAVFLAFNPSGEAAQAWGVVISTDTAFLLGVLALVGPACPTQLRLFLLTLAVADDVGALAVIALFYTDRLAWVPLLLAVAGLGLMLVLRYALAVWRGPAYLVIALGVWVAMHESGVHPTIAGVVIALFTPAFPPRGEEVADAARLTRAFRQSPNPQFARAARLSIERSVSANERLQILFQPWSSFVIVPIFALANAGVALDAATLRTAATSPVTLGVVAGLVLGKLVGILAGVGIAVGLRWGALAPGLTRWQLAGGAALSGIGFTISLFIVDLALDDPALADQARVGVLAGSVIAALLGWAMFRVGDRLRRDDGPRRPTRLDPPVDPARDHIRGPVDAPLTLVEYGDFECPFCGRATGVVEDLRARFGYRLRYVFRHTPLSDVHPHAMLAAEAAEAAGVQGRFWEMHDRLFAHQDQLSAADLLEHAAAVGLDVTRFSRDLGDARFARRVRDDVASAEASGVSSTPTFFVDGSRHTGPYDADTLAARLLQNQGAVDGAAEPSGSAAVPALGSRRRVDGDGGPSVVRAAAIELPPDLVESPDGGAYPRLTSDQIALLQRHGVRRRVEAGEVLFAEGDPGYDFYVVLAGQAAIVENLGQAGQRVVSVSGPARFLGELNLLAAPEPVFLTAVMTRPGEVLDLDAAGLRSAFADSPPLAELVTRAFLLRRSRLLALAAEPEAAPPESVASDGSATLRIIGRAADADTRRLREWAAARQVASTVVDLDDDPGACELLAELGLDVDAAPIAVWHERTVQRANTDDLADLLHQRPLDG